jgi:signal transduction histidine kinase
MSVASLELGGTGASAEKKERAANRWVIVAVVAVSAVLSAFYAINEYASGTGTIVKQANSNAGRFETIFRDLVAARYRAMGLAADTMLQSARTIEPFAKGDRETLIQRIEPFYEHINKNHGVEQLNFWTAPAKLFYRGGRPNEFGMDLSKFRRTIAAATERQQRIMAIETGQGGVVALRAIVPVMFEGKFVGVLEFVSGFTIPLDRASETTGLKWAVSVTKQVSETTERPADPKTDVWQKDDVYFQFSDPTTSQLVRTISFDPRAKSYVLVDGEKGKTVFVKPFQIVNFSGVATITVATLLDVTEAFSEVFWSVVIKTVILFLVLAIGGSYGYVKFGQVRAGLVGVVGRQRKELAERVAFCDAAIAKLKEVDLIKRGFFTNLVTAVNEPLQAVTGQLTALVPAVEKSGDKAISERLGFALAETSRLSRLVEDYQQIELFRQKLVKADSPAVSLADAVGRTIEEELAVYRRLPQLSIAMTVPTDLPPTRADGDLLRRAIANLAGYAAQKSGQGKIVIAGHQDAARWLVLTITGSAFNGAAAPTEALLDESRQFLSQLGAGASAQGVQVGVVLARIIVEFYGGSLAVGPREAPGFVVRLPAAA